MSGESAPLLSTLVERLRGIYRLGVNDGAGLLDGKDTFTRDFGTTPIKAEAADRIEALEAALRRIAEGNLGPDPWQADYQAIQQVASEALAPTASSEGVEA